MLTTEYAPLRFGAHYGTGVVSRLIRWQQRTNVSHISLIDNDDGLIEAREFNGVVKVRTLEATRREQRVDVFTVYVSPESRDYALAWAKSQIGKKYDYVSILRFLTRSSRGRKDNGKWFCSELAFVAAQKAGVDLLHFIHPVEVSPGHFILSPLLRLESTE